MHAVIQNIKRAEPLMLKAQIDYEKGKVVSKTLAQRPRAGITLLAFDESEGLSTHVADGDAMVYVIEGTALITIDEEAHHVTEGSALIIPVGHPHAVKAVTPFKMMLTVVR